MLADGQLLSRCPGQNISFYQTTFFQLLHFSRKYSLENYKYTGPQFMAVLLTLAHDQGYSKFYLTHGSAQSSFNFAFILY